MQQNTKKDTPKTQKVGVMPLRREKEPSDEIGISKLTPEGLNAIADSELAKEERRQRLITKKAEIEEKLEKAAKLHEKHIYLWWHGIGEDMKELEHCFPAFRVEQSGDGWEITWK